MSMEINFDKILFHGTSCGYTLPTLQKGGLLRLESILKSGAILSLTEQQRKLGREFDAYGMDDDDGELSRMFGGVSNTYNGRDYISTCQKTNCDCGNWHEHGYDCFVKKGVSIMLSNRVLTDLEQPKGNRLMHDEIQFKGAIPAEYFTGIAVGIDIDDIPARVQEVAKRAKCELPIYYIGREQRGK